MNHGQPGDTIVCVEQLRKKRGKQQALDGVSFSIPRGRVLGLIGPNGAGKTTTIKILIGLLRPDSGRAEVFGTLPMELAPADRQRIGYLSESTDSELPDLPITELLEYQSHFFAAWDWQWCRQLIDRMGVAPARTLYSMSAGERRKTELLLALAHRPDLLILDDPALGLDALARREILWATLEAVRDEGLTVLFTSHILQDVERIVDDVVILDRGTVRLQGALDEVLARTKRLVLPDAAHRPQPIAGEVRRTQHGRDVVVVTSAFTVGLRDELKRDHPLARVEDLNLEEIFFATCGDADVTEPADGVA